jgi:hypothetical protein
MEAVRPLHPDSASSRVFLLSPAYCGGRRATFLLKRDAALPLAVRLREGTLTLGEAFSFMSGLYFRGKLTYASRFAAEADDCLVITPTRGLQPPSLLVSVALIEEFANTDIAAADLDYRAPLERDLAALVSRLPAASHVVLLGSIASDKYVDVLRPALGARLHYPISFVGRGDMSRGGLLLRQAGSGQELEYVPLDAAATRRGTRPPKLEPLAGRR